MRWRRGRGVRQAAARLARLPRRVLLLLAALACCAAPLLLRLAAAAAAPFTRARELRLPRAWPQCAAPPAERAAAPPPPADALGAWAAAAAPRARAPLRLALVSTYPPTACGLATFAADLRRGVLDAAAAGARPELAGVDVVALHTGPRGSPPPEYPPEARQQRASRTLTRDVRFLLTRRAGCGAQVVRVVRKGVASDYADAAAFIDAQARRSTHAAQPSLSSHASPFFPFMKLPPL